MRCEVRGARVRWRGAKCVVLGAKVPGRGVKCVIRILAFLHFPSPQPRAPSPENRVPNLQPRLYDLYVKVMHWIQRLYFTSASVLGHNVIPFGSPERFFTGGLNIPPSCSSYERARPVRPPARARRLRRRLRRRHQRTQVARDRAPGAAGAQEPAAPRRLRLRDQHRRRRRHPDPDAGHVPAQGRARRRCRRSASTASAWCSCRRTPTDRATRRGRSSRASSPKKVRR